MRLKEYIIFLWLIIVGVMMVCIEQIAPWGVVVGGGIALVTFIAGIIIWIINHYKNKKPFKITRINLQDDISKRGLFAACVKHGTVWNVLFKDKKTLEDIVVKGGNYLVFIELAPRLPLSIDSVKLNFLPQNGDNYPMVVEFEDANIQNYEKYKSIYEGVGFGRWVDYSATVNIAPGKNLYYYAMFTTRDTWKGALSLRFYFVGKEARSVRIPCVVS